MRVVNLLAGPGAGKSTTRAGLFYEMKLAGCKVEETIEYAKELTYEKNWAALSDQLHVTSEQNRRLKRLRGECEFALTDSPLVLGMIYAADEFAEPWFERTLWNLFDSYDNTVVYVERVKAYQSYGRSQSEDEARVIDRRLRNLMKDRIDFFVPGDELAPARIMNFLGIEPKAQDKRAA